MNTIKNFYNLPVYTYSSTHFNLPNWLTNELFKFSLKNIQEQYLYFSKQELYPRETEFHITVLYGIYDVLSNNIEKIIKSYFLDHEINVTLGKVSKFESENYDVLKINVIDNNNDLEEMFEIFSENLNNANKFPLYNPHITLAYIEKNSCDDLIGNDYFDGLEISLNSLKFSSKNPEYSKIFQFKKTKNLATEINNFYKFLFMK